QVRAAQHVTAAARRARRASDRARHQHAITRTEAGDRTTDLDHLADGLMAEAITGVGTEAVTVVDVQVTAADAGGGDAHDRAVLDRVGDRGDRDVPRTRVNQPPHGTPPSSRSVAPVQNDDASVAKNSAAPTISSGLPHRPSASIRLNFSSVPGAHAAEMSVR